VRSYTVRTLLHLFDGLSCRVVCHPGSTGAADPDLHLGEDTPSTPGAFSPAGDGEDGWRALNRRPGSGVTIAEQEEKLEPCTGRGS
jgi:hypothetical protein